MAQIVGTASQDHYKVLGIERDATHEDIKRSYRQLVMENHPDTEGGNADTFLAVQAAYEVLGNQDDRAAYDASVGVFSTWPTGFGWQSAPPRHGGRTSRTTLSEELHGMKITVEVSSWGRRTAIVSLAQFAYLVNAHGYDVFSGEFQSIRIVDGAKTLLDIYDTYSWYVEKEYTDYQNRQERLKRFADYRTRFTACKTRIAEVPEVVQKHLKLDDLVANVEFELLYQEGGHWQEKFDPAKLVSSLIELERKLEWLMKPCPVGTLARELVSGKRQLPDVAFNQSVIEQLQSLQIRSGGLIVPPSEDALFRLYRSRLSGKEEREFIAPIEAYALDLVLLFEDYAPADILEEIATDLLPATMTIEGKECPIEYRYIKGYKGLEDEWVASGVIEVPFSLYRKLVSAEYGKVSQFPEMPGGVKRFLRIMKQGEYYTAGFDTVELAAKVEKMEKGRRRTADAPSAEGPTAPPPWYQGKAKAGRRR